MGEVSILFDESHREMYSIRDYGWFLGFSHLAYLVEELGFSCLSVGRESGLSKVLEKAKTLVFPWPKMYFTRREVSEIWRFVERGGGLWVMGGWSKVLNQLLHKINVHLYADIIVDDLVYDSLVYCPVVEDIERHEITRGVEELIPIFSRSLEARKPARILARCSSRAFSIGHGPYKPGDRPPIMCCAEHGDGRVVVVTDAKMFDNEFITLADHETLASNIIRWLGE